MNRARKPVQVPASDPLPMAELMLRFEAIGCDCHFGAVQRICGAEPLGLLRFTGSSIDNLVSLIESGLADFLTPEDIGVEVRATEYIVFSRRYNDFFAHTNVKAASQDARTVAARQSKKADYLKKRFKLDWQAAERIFVHSGCDDEAAMARLHTALRKMSDCSLLWVTVAQRAEDRGRVEVLAPGFMKGHLAYENSFDDWGFRSDLPRWAAVCRAAEALVRESTEAPLLRAPPVAARLAWAPARCGAVECGADVGFCRVLYDCEHPAPVAQLTVVARFERKSLIVVSVWVRLPLRFRGRIVLLTSRDASPVNFHHADVSVLDTWQQVWLVMRLEDHRDSVTISLDAEAPRASEIVFGGWQVEHGAIPGESLRPSEDARASEAGAVIRARSIPRPAGMRPLIAALLRRAASSLDPAPREPVTSSTEGEVVYDLLRLSNILMEARRFDESDAVLAAGKSLYPWRAELYTHYALSAKSRGHLPMAAERWRDVVLSFPQYAFSHYSLSATLREMGDDGGALVVVEAAISEHFDDPAMVSEAARVFANALRWPDALAHWDRAIALAGETPAWRDARANAAKMAMAAATAPIGEERFPSGEGSAHNVVAAIVGDSH